MQPRAIVLGHKTDEYPGVAAAQLLRVDRRAFDGLPRDLQQMPLLRIHRQRLARRDPEAVSYTHL